METDLLINSMKHAQYNKMYFIFFKNGVMGFYLTDR